MNLTHNAAIEAAERGEWNKAWAIAQEDDGLLPGVTRSQWVAYAERTIETRRQNEEIRRATAHINTD